MVPSASTSTWPGRRARRRQVRAGAPPFLLQHGDADTWVPVDQSIRLADALRGAGGSVELEVVPGADHFFEGADPEPIFERALAFLLRASRPSE